MTIWQLLAWMVLVGLRLQPVRRKVVHVMSRSGDVSFSRLEDSRGRTQMN